MSMSSDLGTLRVRVDERWNETPSIVAFNLVSADGASLPAFSAGAHIDVKLGEGLIRQYSLCNHPAESGTYQIAVLLCEDGRGGSHAMHQVQPNDVIEISRPRNHFPLAHEAKRSLLLGAGIGVTPLVSMAERLHATGADFDFHYCVKDAGHAAFFHRLSTGALSDRMRWHFSGAEHRRIDVDALLREADPETHLYVCGPAGFNQAVLEKARERRWDASRLHYEYFAADPAAMESGDCFEVQIASTGKIFQIAADRSVTDVLIASGVQIATSCEQGVCGSCITRILEGVPDHRDLFLTPEEQAANDQFTPCCSRAKSKRIILDL
jgi:vanillate O-demethylase ferredoxin subunit